MFLLLDSANQSLILGFVPESLGLLIFGIGLILLAIGLRWFIKRSEKNTDGEIKHITK